VTSTDTMANPDMRDVVTGGEPDMSWIDIAVDRNGGVLILDFAPGWRDFIEELHLEDAIDTDADFPAQVGAYRWTNFRIGSWDEGDQAVVNGGTFALPPAEAECAARVSAIPERVSKLGDDLVTRWFDSGFNAGLAAARGALNEGPDHAAG
jgi:hypothetical protein